MMPPQLLDAFSGVRGGDCLTLEFTTGTFFVHVISNYCMCTVPLQFKKLGFEIRPIKGPPRTRGLSNWYYYNICTIQNYINKVKL